MSVPNDLQIEEWENYGDVNPKDHGGLFIKYEQSDKWRVVHTRNITPCSDWEDDRKWKMREYLVEDMDVFENWEDPLAGFSDGMVRGLDSLDSFHRGFDLDTVQRDREAMSHVCHECTHTVMHEIASLPVRANFSCNLEETSDYWGALEDRGICQSDIE